MGRRLLVRAGCSALGLAVCAWSAPGAAEDGPALAAEGGPALVEMAPAHAALEALAPIVDGSPRAIEVAIEDPDDETIVSDAPVLPFRGSLAALGRLGRVDAIVVIDTSASTARRAEPQDRVRERHRGRFHGPRTPASILEQEIRSVERMLLEVEPERTRLGIVTFAGAARDAPSDAERAARLEVSLTDRLEFLDAGLQRIARRGAAGRTNMAAGLDRAVLELTGKGRSRTTSDATRAVVFLTDGSPTLPHADTRANEREVFAAAERAASRGVRVFSFAIGPEAVRRPIAAAEMARRTGGVFTPVRKPAELQDAVTRQVEFAGLGGKLVVRNATLRTGARDLEIADGRFSGWIPLRTGRNDIHVRASAGRRSAEVRRSVHYAPGSVPVWTPPTLHGPPPQNEPTRLELDVTAGQRRTLDFQVGGARKELELGLEARD